MGHIIIQNKSGTPLGVKVFDPKGEVLHVDRVPNEDSRTVPLEHPNELETRWIEPENTNAEAPVDEDPPASEDQKESERQAEPHEDGADHAVR